ncbi:hypothetical protein ANO11243_025040 [Dothideomycetidae sp. 11243]|nr:hypothetical protein ANO11243_025040 [fungal sp. No.11243]
MVEKWLLAGSNAHGVVGKTDGDCRRFTAITDTDGAVIDGTAEVLFVCWSQVVCTIDYPSGCSVRQVFGDHNGIAGVLDHDGKIYMSKEDFKTTAGPPHLNLLSLNGNQPVSHITVAGNGRVAVALKSDLSTDSTLVEEFEDIHHFKARYDTGGEQQGHQRGKQYTIPGQLRDLTSNNSIFACLTESGEVFTWGDARYHGLGRSIHGPTDSPKDQPGVVESLGGIKIVKLCADGWIFAALSEDKAVYLFAALTPGGEHTLRLEGDVQAGGMSLVDIPDAQGNPHDFDDIAIGSGHVLLLCTSGSVSAIGDNKAGQIGTGSLTEHIDQWTEVLSGGCLSIKAGARISLLRAVTS